MKKIKLFSALALTLVMASCDDFDLPNPPGQTNTDPSAYFTDADLELAPVSGNQNLTEFMQANKFVTVANITTLENFPADYTLVIDMEVGSDNNFTKISKVETVIDGNNVTADPALINGAIQNAITKKPGTMDVNVRFPAYAVKGDTKLLLGGLNNYYLTESLNITTFNPDKVIENMYYVVPCGADGTPNWNAAIAMNNNAGAGAIGYDHPEFSIKIESPAPDGYMLKIAPESVMQSRDASQLLGVNVAEDGFGGKLGTDYGVGHITITGDVLITINAEQDSITFSYAFNVLYPYTGTLKADALMLLYTDNYITYSGVCAINNQWFLGAYPDKKAEPLFKQDAESTPEISKDELSMNGLLSTASDAALIKTPAKGNHLYWVSVDLPGLTYSMTVINDLGIVGAFNGWNEKENVQLTPSKDFKTWTATDVEIDGEFKINANKDWAIGFSGVMVSNQSGTVVYNVNKQDGGANLSVESGKYDVELNFTVQPYVLTLKKK
ncbi:MAG: hypothetical protein K2K81_07030 [Muribaculaceae bacterium]|nr:hypothetical protein [Muribaculaceae bacterium]MDE6409981.1 hypothetical protein [Muribaculaceae bacterium]